MVASIAYIAAHYVVGVIRFRYQIAGVYADLEGRKQSVVPWLVALRSNGHTHIFVFRGGGEKKREQ